MTATPLTVNTTIPVSVVITGADLVYSDPDLTTPVTAWPVAISAPSTWYIPVNDTAPVHVVVTATHAVVLVDRVAYLDAAIAYTIDADLSLNPLRLAEILAPPDTWAES
ncbi:MAG TPA: hypothetical protein VIJ96_01830 [Acidothermaceae bacterium]